MKAGASCSTAGELEHTGDCAARAGAPGPAPDGVARGMSGEAPPPIPEQIGPCRFGLLGLWITVQCPAEFDTLMIQTGGTWHPGKRRWLFRLHRLGGVVRALRRRFGGDQ